MTLKELFELQGSLNIKVGFDHEKFAAVFARSCSREDILIEAGQWIDDFLKAMSSEIEELRRHTYWKHWCSEAQNGRRYMVKDLDAARGEVIDMLHFWVNLAQAVGMTPDIVEEMYRSKLGVNIKRQDVGYSIAAKDEVGETPDCCKCGKPCKAGYVLTGDGPICGGCV